MKPESTSPEPAVASHGGALELIAARPPRRCDHRVRTFENDDRARLRGRSAGTINLRAGDFTEEPFELALVRRHYDGCLPGLYRSKQRLGANRRVAIARQKAHAGFGTRAAVIFIRKRRQRVGVEHGGRR